MESLLLYSIPGQFCKKVKENAEGKNVFHVYLYKKGGSTSIHISNRLFFINLKIVY